jgi:hypothetical protein
MSSTSTAVPSLASPPADPVRPTVRERLARDVLPLVADVVAEDEVVDLAGPTASSAVCPNSSAAAGFQAVTRCSASITTTATGLISTSDSKCYPLPLDLREQGARFWIAPPTFDAIVSRRRASASVEAPLLADALYADHTRSPCRRRRSARRGTTSRVSRASPCPRSPPAG